MSVPIKRPYVSSGHVLSSPPLTVRLRGTFETAILCLGLYITTLFSIDPYAAGQASAYNIHNRAPDGSRTGKGFFRTGGGYGGGSGSGGGGGGGGGPGPGSGGGGARKQGKIDDIREPECNSCG